MKNIPHSPAWGLLLLAIAVILGGPLLYSENAAPPTADQIARYRKAAEQGHTNAQVNLGHCYFIGNGVPKDSSEAAKWLRKAAEQGDAIAQVNLGNLYLRGEGIVKDSIEAYKWWLLAGGQGNMGQDTIWILQNIK